MTQHTTLIATPELLAALRIGLHQTTQAASFANALKLDAQNDQMHGIAALHESNVKEAERAAEVIRAAIRKATTGE